MSLTPARDAALQLILDVDRKAPHPLTSDDPAGAERIVWFENDCDGGQPTTSTAIIDRPSGQILLRDTALPGRAATIPWTPELDDAIRVLAEDPHLFCDHSPFPEVPQEVSA
jgi:hypothetical protein